MQSISLEAGASGLVMAERDQVVTELPNELAQAKNDFRTNLFERCSILFYADAPASGMLV
jgi:hypothetical protein